MIAGCGVRGIRSVAGYVCLARARTRLLVVCAAAHHHREITIVLSRPRRIQTTPLTSSTGTARTAHVHVPRTARSRKERTTDSSVLIPEKRSASHQADVLCRVRCRVRCRRPPRPSRAPGARRRRSCATAVTSASARHRAWRVLLKCTASREGAGVAPRIKASCRPRSALASAPATGSREKLNGSDVPCDGVN